METSVTAADQLITPPKIESLRHLQDAYHAVIVTDVKEGEVAEYGHPDVARDEDPDDIVEFNRVVVVVQEEEELHPSLPFFGLVAAEYLKAWVGWGETVRGLRLKVLVGV